VLQTNSLEPVLNLAVGMFPVLFRPSPLRTGSFFILCIPSKILWQNYSSQPVSPKNEVVFPSTFSHEVGTVFAHLWRKSWRSPRRTWQWKDMNPSGCLTPSVKSHEHEACGLEVPKNQKPISRRCPHDGIKTCGILSLLVLTNAL
jgi:hypothetical protein